MFLSGGGLEEIFIFLIIQNFKQLQNSSKVLLWLSGRGVLISTQKFQKQGGDR